MDRARREPAPADGHLKDRDDELGAHVGLHRPANDPAAEKIPNGGEILPALAGADLLDVGRLRAIGSVGPEFAADEVTERLYARDAHRAALATALEGPRRASAARRRFSPTPTPSRPSIACTRGLP
jgi:hypothetical protein